MVNDMEVELIYVIKEGNYFSAFLRFTASSKVICYYSVYTKIINVFQRNKYKSLESFILDTISGYGYNVDKIIFI